MATENEELQQLVESVRQGFLGLADSTNKLTPAQEKLKAQIDLTMQGLSGVAKFGAAVGKGETDLKAFNGIIDTTTGLMGSMAKAIPVIGDAIAGVAKGLGDAAKMAVNAIDNTAKSFVEIGKVGGLTADGMSGVREQFMRAGLTLQSFQKQVVENSQALARFQGTTGAGADEFATMVGTLTKDTTGAGMELRRLGVNADEIAETSAAFVAQQTRLGRSQNMTQQQLTAGTVEYAKELDLLSKVTGLSRSAIQKQQEAALSESKFRANYELAMQSGDAARIKGAEGMMTLQTRMQSFGADLGQGVRDLSAGVANTDAAKKMVASTGGAALDIINRLKAGAIDQDQAQQELAAAYERNKNTQLQIASQVGGTIGVFSDTAQSMDFINAAQKGQYTKAKAVQDAQTKGNDKLTDQTVSAQQNLEKMNQELNLLGFTLLPNAAKVVATFSSVMAKGLAQVNKILGISDSESADGGPRGPGDAMRGPATKGIMNRGGDGGGAGPGAGNIMRGPATKGIMNRDSGAAPASVTGGPPSINALDFIKFTGGTGSEDHFKQLQPHVQSAFLQMAQEYNNLTGKKLQVNSAFRSPDEQANVNSGTNPKAAPGMSLHNFGRALDIQSDQVADLASNGLLGKFGFNTLAGDPPHISMANGGILSGPTNGYRPNLSMHGAEAVVPLPDGRSIPVTGGADSSGIMQAQLSKLEELVTVMKSQLSVSNKLLSYSS
jgi:hypothetical protein